MKIWPVSDLHLRQTDAMHLLMPFGIPEADVCLLGGDVTEGFANAMHWAGNIIAQKMRVVMVHGNHDVYRSSIDRANSESKMLARAYPNIHFLENDEIVIDGVRFVGATLWTDYRLPVGGRYTNKTVEERLKEIFHVVPRELVDFGEIHRSDERQEGETGFITIQELIRRHEESRAYIDQTLATPFDGKTVVLTHHAPLGRSIHPSFDGEITNAAFASDLSDLIARGKPAAWVHGHVHHFLDYVEADTRIICNAKGHSGQRNPSNFKWDFTFEV
jgi:Icc-related predicted phosphoesterase